MASVSSTSSLGNTSLRGFGGMASGIDRDAIIEKMTLGTTTKITNEKSKMTQLQWKQEAYRSISDKIIDWSDKYASYSSSTNLKDPTVFAKNQITVHGKEDSKGLVTVTGTSDMVGTVSILGVMGTASSAVLQSGEKKSDNGLEMSLKDLAKTTYKPGSFSAGAEIYFDSVAKTDGNPVDSKKFTLKDKYTIRDANNKVLAEKSVNYAPQSEEEFKELADALNAQLKDQDAELAKTVQFEVGADNKSIQIKLTGNQQDVLGQTYELRANYASKALGYEFEKDGDGKEKGIALTDISSKPPTGLKLSGQSTLDTMAGGKLIFEYNGVQKSVEMITKEEAAELKKMTLKDTGKANELLQIAQDAGLTTGAGGFDENSTVFDLYDALNQKLYEADAKLNRPGELDEELKKIDEAKTEYIKLKEDIDKRIDDVDAKIAASTDEAEKKELEELKASLTDTQGKYAEQIDNLTTLYSQFEDEKKEAEDVVASEGPQLTALKEMLEGKDGAPGALDRVSEIQSEKVAEKIAGNIEKRLGQAFGKDILKVEAADGKLRIKADGENGTSGMLSVLANDTYLLNAFGVEYGASNKVNVDGKLTQDALKLDKDGNGQLTGYFVKGKDEDGNEIDTDQLDLRINGVQIKGLTKNSTVYDIMSAINSNKDAGVKATYVESTGKFMLVATETGTGRKIDMDDDEANSKLAQDLFGGAGSESKDGTNAKVLVSYGNGAEVMLERSSNTFNLEGLTVTVSGEFGNIQEKKDENGNVIKGEYERDKSAAVTFSAKADVEGALKKVKEFIEEYNALVTEINSQITTRPNSDYGPLTDEQKAEMDETSIENWEKKAKQGMLYGDSAMRDLSMDVQSVFTKMMSNGARYEEDLKAIGITYSEDWGDGGTLVFDESKFKEAMESDPEKVSNVFTGGGNVSKGLIDTINDTFTPYATRYANLNGGGNGKGSYGRLIEIAGSEKKPTTLMDNQIYKQLKEMQETIDSLNDRLKVEQDRYISQFTTMETLLNQMNTQSSYLSQLTA